MNPTVRSIVDQHTRLLLERGIRVFQGARLGPDELSHVASLLDMMDPPEGAAIIDLGCGVGEVARLMHELRPDLKFILVNNNALQLSHAPPEFPQIEADFHNVPLPDRLASGVMFLYSLGHADYPKIFAEAARLTCEGGFLFVYDYERISGVNDLMQQRLNYAVWDRLTVDALAEKAGWDIETWDRLLADDRLFREVYNDDYEYNLIFDELRLCAWKARRK